MRLSTDSAKEHCGKSPLPPETPTSFMDLPDELQEQITSLLLPKDVASCALSCRHWHALTQDEYLRAQVIAQAALRTIQKQFHPSLVAALGGAEKFVTLPRQNFLLNLSKDVPPELSQSRIKLPGQPSKATDLQLFWGSDLGGRYFLALQMEGVPHDIIQESWYHIPPALVTVLFFQTEPGNRSRWHLFRYPSLPEEAYIHPIGLKKFSTQKFDIEKVYDLEELDENDMQAAVQGLSDCLNKTR